ncbi:MAG: restriction endonuclease subunit S [Rikenellaceae bacterium]
MSENKDIKTALPKLRFPEFANDQEWNLRLLNSIGDTYGGLSGKSAKDFGEGEPYLTYKQIFGNSRIDLSKCEFVSICDEKQNEVDFGDVLVTMSSETAGEIAFTSTLLDRPIGSLYLNSFCFGYRVFDLNCYSPYFLRYLFRSPQYRKEVSILAQGAIRYNISKTTFKKLELFFPEDIEEQTRIAECLSSLDDAISGVSDKIEALKEYKKGLMQQLFPAEGKTTPAFRFPEFKDSEEWESHSIKSVCSSYSGGTPSTTEPKYYGGTIPFIRSAEINKETTELFLTEEGLLNSSAKLVEKGSVLVALYGANSGDVAISKVDGAINQAILCLKSKWNNAFICYYLTLKKNWIINTYIQGGQGNLSGEIIKSVSLLFPNLKEQQRIATTLLALDNVIEIQTNQLEQLKAHKKGLMQQLFPNLNE